MPVIKNRKNHGPLRIDGIDKKRGSFTGWLLVITYPMPLFERLRLLENHKHCHEGLCTEERRVFGTQKEAYRELRSAREKHPEHAFWVTPNYNAGVEEWP